MKNNLNYDECAFYGKANIKRQRHFTMFAITTLLLLIAIFVYRLIYKPTTYETIGILLPFGLLLNFFITLILSWAIPLSKSEKEKAELLANWKWQNSSKTN